MKLTKDLTKSIFKKQKNRASNSINFLFFFSFLFLLVFSVSSQIVSPFNIRYQVNQKGGIKILSNVSVSCGSTANNCTTAQGEIPPSGNYQNGSFTMSYVDIDGDATTFSSSKDSLTLPNCSEILWAGLYWGGRIAANTTNYATRNQIKVKVGNGIYQPFTADQTLDVPTINGANWSHPSYFCFKNITPLVVSSGLNARFTVADLVTRTGTSNMWGGWSIVVVYKNVLQTMRNLTVFDGFANVSTGNSLDIPISGFTTPLSGPVNFELGVIACDGDRDSQGDQLQFNGAGTFVNISDALHQTNNFFNSTISDNAVLTPFRLPNYSNTLGYDAGIFYPNNTGLNYIGNNANSAIIRVSTSSENILARAFTSAIDIFEPDLRATVYVQDLNGGTVNPGDVLEYRVVGKNIGSDVSLNTFMTDTLDIRTNFVPGSIQYMNGPYIGPKTDGFGDDQAEYDPINRVVITRVNIGANALNGGTMNNSPNGADSAVIKFQVVVVNDCLILSCDSTINNKAYIFGTGNISSNFYTNNGTSDIYDANGCPTNNNNELTINTVACPDISIAHNQVCIGDTLHLSMINSLYANYFWTGPNGFSSNLANPTINNVVAANAGVYFLNITFNGSTCTYYNIVDTVVIDPNPIITLVNLTNISCFNANNGSISVSASSTPPYSYLWSNSSTSAIINNLSPGNYTVTVNDNLTCHSTATYTITQPNLLVANAVVTSNYNGQQISCFNASDGTATVNVIGGTQPYSYL
ncbi:MAG: SprB repeat-containing protein, partial [Flavobacteriia bacterium]|nr:SprB repeat-containing protein [Flavobacteriia bacterium]